MMLQLRQLRYLHSDRILIGMCDIAEEVARFYGYANIPTALPSGEATAGKLSDKLRIDEIARRVALLLWIFTGNDIFI